MKINFMQVRKIILAILLLISFNIKAASTDFYSNKNQSAKISILSSFDHNNNLILGAHFKINPDWYIYSPTEDGFSQEPEFNFTGSSNINIKNYKILWPKSIKKVEYFGDEKYWYNIYENEVIIPIRLQILDPNQNIRINLEINYGICNKICIPAKNNFSFDIAKGEKDSKSLSLIAKFSDQIIENFNYSYFLKILIFAFIGGLILNIMPCVLPVLSVKLISVVKYSNLRTSRIKKIYFATILGIIFTFIILALFTIILREIGSAFGWGLQFQNPYFLIIIALILTIFISNLSGNFDINFNTNIISKLDQKITKKERERNIFIANFMSGILAVLLATPCSAPFLGTSISFALTQNNIVILSIFFAISIGFAFPYFALILFPHSVKLLPKSGAWTTNVKHVMSGLLIATLVWIIYIISNNIGFSSSMLVVLILVGILAFLKLTKNKLSYQKRFIFLILMSLFILICPVKLHDKMVSDEKNYQNLWMEFDEKLLENYINQEKVILIDITADWCITCKVNKFTVLNKKQITNKIKSGEIIAMRGDMTKPNQILLDFISKYNRYGIPFNIIYGPNAKDGILTSELLTVSSILKILEQASKK
jgi:suppressor for copper-sensitivity B